MITRKFVYCGVAAMMIGGSALAVNAQSTTVPTHPAGPTGTLNQLAQRFEGVVSQFQQLAQATPQPTAAPAAQAAAVPQSAYVGVRVEDTAKGVTVREVVDASPAASAGLKVDDIIQKANGNTVKNVMEFAQAILKMKPDDSLKLDVMRADKATAITVKVGSQDLAKAFTLPAAMPYDGLTYNPAEKSWQVFQLSDRSLLYSAGLRTNDQITGFDGKLILPADFQSYRDAVKADANIKLAVTSAGKQTSITVSGAAIKSLDAFSYDKNGLLIDVLTSGKGTSPKLDNLTHVTPVNAIAYNGKNWQIYSLVDGSELQKSGLQVNDQIRDFDGKTYDPAAMRTWLATLQDSATIKLTVDRNGKSQQISVPAANLIGLYLVGDTNSALFFGLPENGFKPSVGVDAVALTDALAKEHQLKQTTGALVTTIQPNSVAAAAGIQMNDVITAISSQKIDAQHDFKSLLDTLKPGEAITLDVARGDKTIQLKATLPQPDVTGEIPFLIPPL